MSDQIILRDLDEIIADAVKRYNNSTPEFKQLVRDVIEAQKLAPTETVDEWAKRLAAQLAQHSD